jgi:hypothetical protein
MLPTPFQDFMARFAPYVYQTLLHEKRPALKNLRERSGAKLPHLATNIARHPARKAYFERHASSKVSFCAVFIVILCGTLAFKGNCPQMGRSQAFARQAGMAQNVVSPPSPPDCPSLLGWMLSGQGNRKGAPDARG